MLLYTYIYVVFNFHLFYGDFLNKIKLQLVINTDDLRNGKYIKHSVWKKIFYLDKRFFKLIKTHFFKLTLKQSTKFSNKVYIQNSF